MKRSKVDFCCGSLWRKLMGNHHLSTQRSQEGRDEGRVAVISCKQIIDPQVFLKFSIIAWQACTSGPINGRDRGCGQPRRKASYSYSPLQLYSLFICQRSRAESPGACDFRRAKLAWFWCRQESPALNIKDLAKWITSTFCWNGSFGIMVETMKAL